jgi:hypothetical protein
VIAQQLRIGAAVLRDAGEFLTDRGADGLEGTGLVAFSPAGDGWRAEMFVAPEQRGQRAELGCWVEVTEWGKRELVARLPTGCRYLARVHSHPAAAFHSRTDDTNPALSHEGAISVVVRSPRSSGTTSGTWIRARTLSRSSTRS